MNSKSLISSTPRIHGVNLGGWLVLEPFISPSMFQDPRVVDEYTYAQYLHDDEASMQALRNHWDTWITEADVELMAQTGITHVRIPIGLFHLKWLDSS